MKKQELTSKESRASTAVAITSSVNPGMSLPMTSAYKFAATRSISLSSERKAVWIRGRVLRRGMMLQLFCQAE